MKKITIRTVLLALVCFICLCCTNARAISKNIEIDGVTYTVFYETYLYHVSGGEPGQELIIPEVLDGKPITTVVSNCFSNTVFGSIVLPDSITSIEGSAFSNCKYLTSVTLPQGITHFNAELFRGCTSLTEFTIPEGVTTIGDSAFRDCTALSHIVMPDSVTTIDQNLFSGCTSLKEAILSDMLTELPRCTFSNCTSLKNVSFPKSLKTIGYIAFKDCDSLTELVLPDGITSISNYAFQSCDALASVTLPEGLTVLENDVFYDCPSLISLSLPDSLVKAPDALLGIPNTLNLFAKPNPDFILTVGENSPLLPTIQSAIVPYRIRETGELFNIAESTAKTVDQKVKDIVAAYIRPGMSDYDKALTLHNWLVKNAYYDFNFKNYQADGVLLKGCGVCNSYAKAYELLLDAVGIENCLERGDDHIWNMVKLDGDWYHIDVTWDDPLEGQGIAYSGMESCDFFGLPNYVLEGMVNHECYDKPHIATAYKYNYAYRSGKLNGHLEAFKEDLEVQLASGQAEFSFAPEKFTFNPDLMYNRLAYLVIRDTTYTFRGHKVHMTVDYDRDENFFTVRLTGFSDADLTLPVGVSAVQAEAFAGARFGVVHLSDRVQSVGDRAFADCPNLYQILIPASVTSIADNAFEGVTGLCIFGQSGSKAEAFAVSHGYGFVSLD